MTAPISNSPGRILVVDNDVKLRTMLSLMLTGHGYEVSQTDNGEEAVALHRRQPFDLVITELAIDGQDGFQTIMELRQEPGRAKIIAIAGATLLPADFRLRIAEHLGAQFVLAKPFQPEQLLSAVQNALEKT